MSLRRLTLTAMVVGLLGTALMTALPAQASETTPSTSCNRVGGTDVCATTPTQACISDQGTCPFSPPVCYYNGENPTPVGQLSCHENAPPPNPNPTYTRLCVEHGDTTVICVGGQNQDRRDRTCPWVDIVIEPLGTVECRSW